MGTEQVQMTIQIDWDVIQIKIYFLNNNQKNCILITNSILISLSVFRFESQVLCQSKGC